MAITKTKTFFVKEKYFKGDILITDPCYICKDRDESTKPKWSDYIKGKEADYPDYNGCYSKQFSHDYDEYYNAYYGWYDNNPSDWTVCEYGDKFEKLNIYNYLTNTTYYGDWGCTVYDTDTKEKIGEFCADAGLCSVFLLDEVRKYNPDIDTWIEEHSWCACVIKNFDGTVTFERLHTIGTRDEDCKYWKKGDSWTDDILKVTGKGNINFVNMQTSL